MNKNLPKPGDQGRVLAVSISDRKGVVKHNIPRGRLVADHGLESDAHAGSARQVSLLAQESIGKMIALGAAVSAGDFAENITTQGIEVMALPVGTVLKIGGEALVEVTQIGKACHNKGCAIKQQVGECVMPREGIFVKVLEGGEIKPGDIIEVISVPGGHTHD
jgi:MOSC domain-containing protein YiiM